MGFATWTTLSPTDAVSYYNNPINLGVNVNFNDPSYYDTSAYIDLPAGRWFIKVTLVATGDYTGALNGLVKLSVSFSESTGNNPPISTDLETGSINGICWPNQEIGNAGPYTLLRGTMIINNKTTATKRYHLVVGNTESNYPSTAGPLSYLGGGSYVRGENNVIAFRIPN